MSGFYDNRCSVMDGKTFKEKIKVPICKLTNYINHHNDFHYKEGLNVDHKPFYTEGQCQAGGLYFCPVSNFDDWMLYAGKTMYWWWDCEIPDDAQVYVESFHKAKASALILSNPRPIYKVPEFRRWAENCVYSFYPFVAALSSWFADALHSDDLKSIEWLGNQSSAETLSAILTYHLKYESQQHQLIVLDELMKKKTKSPVHIPERFHMYIALNYPDFIPYVQNPTFPFKIVVQARGEKIHRCVPRSLYTATGQVSQDLQTILQKVYPTFWPTIDSTWSVKKVLDGIDFLLPSSDTTCLKNDFVGKLKPKFWEQKVAIEKDPSNIRFIANPSPEIQFLAVEQDSSAIQWIQFPCKVVKRYVNSLC